MMVKIVSYVVLVLMLVSMIAGPLYAQDDGFPRDVQDATDTTVTIPARPERVIVVSESTLLETLLPPDSLIQFDPNTGDLAAVEWDGVGLLVLSDLYAAAFPDLVTAAEAAGVPVFQTRLINSLFGWRIQFENLALAAGQEDRAAEMLMRLDTRLFAIEQALVGREPVHVLVLTPEGYTFGEESFFTELVELAGGLNVAAAFGFDDYRQVDDNAIRTLAPDVIFLSPAWNNFSIQTFVDNPAYAAVPAVSNGRVYRLPFRPTLPADPGAAVVAMALYLHPVDVLMPQWQGG